MSETTSKTTTRPERCAVCGGPSKTITAVERLDLHCKVCGWWGTSWKRRGQLIAELRELYERRQAATSSNRGAR